VWCSQPGRKARNRQQPHYPGCAKPIGFQFTLSFERKGIRPNKPRILRRSSVENFLHNQHDRAQAQKRGGGQALLSLNYQDAEQRYQIEPVEESDPATIFEQQWAATLLETILNRLRQEFSAEGRAGVFDDLQGHLWGDVDSIPYTLLAQNSGLTEGNLKTIAHRLRQRYRALLREEIAQTVAKPGEVDDEIRHLIRIVSQ